jgi:hypothetical protein
MKQAESILATASLLFGSGIMIAGLTNQSANLGFLLALGLVPVNLVIASDLYRGQRRQSKFSLAQFFVQDSALFLITFGLLLLSLCLIILRGFVL